MARWVAETFAAGIAAPDGSATVPASDRVIWPHAAQAKIAAAAASLLVAQQLRLIICWFGNIEVQTRPKFLIAPEIAPEFQTNAEADVRLHTEIVGQ
jgi:hypothetical protein